MTGCHGQWPGVQAITHRAAETAAVIGWIGNGRTGGHVTPKLSFPAERRKARGEGNPGGKTGLNLSTWIPFPRRWTPLAGDDIALGRDVSSSPYPPACFSQSTASW